MVLVCFVDVSVLGRGCLRLILLVRFMIIRRRRLGRSVRVRRRIWRLRLISLLRVWFVFVFILADLDALIKHGVTALRETLPRRKSKRDKDPDKLDGDNTVIAIVGKDTPFRILTTEEVDSYIEQVETANPRDVIRFDMDNIGQEERMDTDE